MELNKEKIYQAVRNVLYEHYKKEQEELKMPTKTDDINITAYNDGTIYATNDGGTITWTTPLTAVTSTGSYTPAAATSSNTYCTTIPYPIAVNGLCTEENVKTICKEEMEHVDRHVDKLEEDIEYLNDKRHELEETVTLLNDKCHELEDKNTTLEGIIEILKINLSNLTSQMNGMETYTNYLKDLIKALSDKVEAKNV